MNGLLILPLVLPLGTAALSLVLPRHAGLRRGLALLATAGLLGVSVLLVREVGPGRVLAMQVGAWPAPLGVTLVVDVFSALNLLLSSLMGLLAVVYAAGSLEERMEAGGHHPLVLVLLAGVNGSFLTGDLFNLFVWFEVMLVASFVLLALEAERERLEASIKYMTLSLLGSALFLTALAVLYGAVGTLNLADMARRVHAVERPGLVTTGAVLLLVVFGLKAATFPFFFWLPASYHTPPVVVTALFSALLTKVGVYALFRTYTLVFVGDRGLTHQVVLWVALLSMVTGVLGAVAQYDFRRLLSFHIISQIGYLLVGVALSTRAALAASVVYWVHYVCAKTALFFVSGVTERVTGTHSLEKMGGLSRSHPWLAALFLVPALSLAGVPPFSGFFAKAALLRAALLTEAWGVAAVGALVGLLTLYSMMKVWREAFWKVPPRPAQGPLGPVTVLGPCAVLGLMMGALGLGARPLFELADVAAEQLLEPQAYLHAVLGGAP